ncbi:MAG TPA: winged helix-turn-helix domain-containing protein [Kiritimatiellia bacterium]|nr:winged helix-turn-helix domain-containing protein [Kiritimatiellia bacterium]HMP34269.1 winged helix-turn-helix domain-containing protein [Kiritimatiellia bacterium]
MIMTKEKVRELNALTASRAAGSESLPAEGVYHVAATQDAFLMRNLSDSGDIECFVMGMVIPAHKAAAVCQLLQDDQGMMPSPVFIFKKTDRTAGASASASRKPVESTSRFENVDASVGHDQPTIRVKNIEIIPGRHEVRVNGKLVVLTFSEFRILQTLAAKPGWVFSRDQIIHAVHGNDYNCTERAVDVQVTGLRKKLGAAGEHVETVRGVGYRFSE